MEVEGSSSSGGTFGAPMEGVTKAGEEGTKEMEDQRQAKLVIELNRLRRFSKFEQGPRKEEVRKRNVAHATEEIRKLTAAAPGRKELDPAQLIKEALSTAPTNFPTPPPAPAPKASAKDKGKGWAAKDWSQDKWRDSKWHKQPRTGKEWDRDQEQELTSGDWKAKNSFNKTLGAR